MKGALPRWAPVASGALALLAFAEAMAADPHDALITRHASANGVPEALVRRVILIESRGNPYVISNGNYGLMQIRFDTARALGYGGTAEGLLDPDINITYGVKYLGFAYRAAGCNESGAIANYQRGFYGKPQSNCGPRPQPATVLVAAEEPLQPPNAVWPKVVQVLTFVRPQSYNLQAPPPETVNGLGVSEPARSEPARSKPAQSAALQLAAAPAETRSPNLQLSRLPPLPAWRPEAAAPQTVAKGFSAEDAWPPVLSPPPLEVVTLPMPKPRPDEAPKAFATLDTVGSDEPPVEAATSPVASSAKLDAQAVPLPQPRPAIKFEVAATPKRDARPARRASHGPASSEPEKEQPSGFLAVFQKLTPPSLARSDTPKAEQPPLISLFQKLTTPAAAEPQRPRQ